ncbi:MAG: UvrD-helicase domain-containing protein [Propionibacteriales bacterium]|nr:UvrD-helicase domain-containing protein [Propionibacteriales bacterium]
MVKGDALTATVDELQRIRADVLRHHKFNAGRPAATKAVLGLLRRRWNGLDPAHATDDETDDEVFAELVTASATWQMFWHAWWPAMTAAGVLAHLADPIVAARVAGNDLSARELSALTANIDPGDWTVADTALLDELVAILGPPPPADDQPETSLFLEEGASVDEVVTTADRLSRQVETDPFAEPHATYNHVLVDEAQDITPMQWRMLRRRGSHASWTIVGDPAQSSWPDPDETRRAVKELIGNAPQRQFRMSTNYRSPAEVYDLAGRVVLADHPDADLPKAVRSTGVDPDLRTEADLGTGAVRAAVDLAGLVEGSIGVIAPESVINSIRETLANAPGLAEAGDRVVVVTPLASKGLEYDGVVVVSPDDIVAESPGGVRVLYVALTRPTQRLITIDRAGGGDWQKSLASPLTDSA